MSHNYAEEWFKNKDDVENHKCCICFQLCLDDKVHLSCQHSFCAYCIFKWVKTNPTCPMCRIPIKSIIDEVTFSKPPNSELTFPCECKFNGSWQQIKDHFRYDCPNGFNELKPPEFACSKQGCKNEEKPIILECGHSWHDQCRIFWLKMKIDCPLCDVRKCLLFNKIK